MGEQEEVDNLANSLKSSGLAMSWIDAINKAKAILGFGVKTPSVKVEEPKEEQKAKVDEIIQEVEKEIEEMKEEQKVEAEPQVEEKPEQVLQQEELSKFEDPDFNIAESNLKVEDVVKAAEKDDKSDEIFTNDPETLDKEKEGDKFEEEDSLIKTNEELNDDLPEDDSDEENFDVNQEG